MKIWEPKPAGTLWATQGLLLYCFTFTFNKKRNFRQLLRNRKTAQKLVYIPMDFVLNTKKGNCLPFVSSIFKKSVLKLLGRTVYVLTYITCPGN